MKSQQTSSRYVGFDILKYICAFLVILIHRPLPGTLGKYLDAVSRISVPVFFMISGFFYSDVLKKGREGKQLRKIFLLAVKANLLYLIWNCCYYFMLGKNVPAYLTKVFSSKNMKELLLLNASPLRNHLWYLSAILYVLLIMFAANRLRMQKVLWILTPVLLAGDLVLGKYSLLLLHREFPYIYARNFLFVGIPYFCIGMMLRECKKTLKPSILVGLSLFFAFTTLLERYILVHANLSTAREHYISTTFMAVSVFLAAKEIYRTRSLSLIEKAVAYAGRNYSAWIYIIHPIFLTILSRLTKQHGVYYTYLRVGPFVVCILSTAFVALITEIRKKITSQ